MSNTTSHIRSNSLPSKSSHTLNLKAIGIALLKFSNNLEIECSSSSASSICQKLCEIKKLYEGIENSIRCPSNQQALSLEQHRIVVEKVLDGSLSLLDFCAFINDVLSSMKESMFEFESCIRRKNNGCKEGIIAYMMSRKKIHKMVSKYLKNLQVMSYKKGDICIDVVRMLKEVETIRLLTLKHVLAYFARSEGKENGWSLMAKLTKSKNLGCEKQEDGNELRKIDQIIFDLESKETNIEVKMAQDMSKQLASIELAMFEFEECLEAISRCLLKIRVSLLNILSH